MATCAKCPAEIEWAITEKKPDGLGGRALPLDVGTHDNGNLIVIGQAPTARGVSPIVRYVKPGEGDRISHFATCPNAKSFRRG